MNAVHHQNSSAPVIQQCAGFSLLEVLIAMVLFSISLLGLLRYQQVLLAQFSHYADAQYAWRLANQALDIYPAVIDNEQKLLAGQWVLNVNAVAVLPGCEQVGAQVTAPGNIDVTLTRLICR
ncbi:type IV pilus modification PilV family protein [Budvicia diplopodorum]|uniref:type IV pilus modification PilV family protein n=1 Tax=Budvicia diplopodorum TaxID=1119056 RepID=UPI001356C59A|nr:prepilin-type N-terminal cleavage/methylation domain-containing protein [Budvicia diplopodorum]